ncbi:phosphatase PAP2 family protein [Sphingomonas sp. 2R-10]|uniref:phosphatase PAP2 family protein n=1 Tax=Sphingomonas sp. 2R-10 TaxID=3045148 RepID=UPI0024BADD68|nr:phosphatase PAP2 family protein [Sphingomonas sp. 2R-10]
MLLGYSAVYAETMSTQQNRYLVQYPTTTSLKFPLPPKPPSPKESDAGMIDLDQVRASQFVDAAAKVEAFQDAEAYSYDSLLPRFETSAGRTLSKTKRPILAHILNWVLADAGTYSDIKTGPARQRPFVEDPSIVPCYASYLMQTPPPAVSYTYSYPSGHATNGYLAGLVLAEVMPDRRAAVMARGVRYGTNRVICGVHYPTDVAVGQVFARFLFSKIDVDPRFRRDVDCAIEEDVLDRLGKLHNGVSSNLSAACGALSEKYRSDSTKTP